MTDHSKPDIKVGDAFIWEPNDPSAWCQVVVTAIGENGNIQCKDIKTGRLAWNTRERFNEAVIAVKGS